MRAFYCTEVPDTVENAADYDGCAVECQDDEILIADPRWVRSDHLLSINYCIVETEGVSTV